MEFVMETKAKLGAKAMGRRALDNNEGYALRESQSPYNRVFDPEKCSLRPKNEYIITKRQFVKNLKEVREKGYATDLAEEILNLHCVACPIFNHKLEPNASIWITGPSDRLQPERFDEFGGIIGEFALRISRRFGYEPELNGHSA